MARQTLADQDLARRTLACDQGKTPAVHGVRHRPRPGQDSGGPRRGTGRNQGEARASQGEARATPGRDQGRDPRRRRRAKPAGSRPLGDVSHPDQSQGERLVEDPVGAQHGWLAVVVLGRAGAGPLVPDDTPVAVVDGDEVPDITSSCGPGLVLGVAVDEARRCRQNRPGLDAQRHGPLGLATGPVGKDIDSGDARGHLVDVVGGTTVGGTAQWRWGVVPVDDDHAVDVAR